MKLFTNWPSKSHWTFLLRANLAYKEKWQKDLETINNNIMEATGAGSLTVSFLEKSDLDLSLDFDTLNNDERIFRLFPILKEFGLFGFEAELVASADNGCWDAYVAWYEYCPARWHGIKRTYISCSECKALVHCINVENYYPTFNAVLWLRYDETVQEHGGTLYLDFNNRLITNKEPVLTHRSAHDGNLQN